MQLDADVDSNYVDFTLQHGFTVYMFLDML
jgi:hypothetical protein